MNGDGCLSYDEFKEVFKMLDDEKQVKVPESELESLMKALDLDNSGMIDYTEFLSAFTVNSVYTQENYLKDIFNKLDKVLSQIG